MKQTVRGFVIGFLVCSLLSATVVFAAGGVTKEIFYGVNVVVDGKAVQTADDNRPFIMDNRIFLPLRAVSDAFNKTIEWNSDTKTAYIGSMTDTSNPSTVVTAFLPDVVLSFQSEGWSRDYSSLKSGGKESVMMGGIPYSNAIYIAGMRGYIVYDLKGQYTQLSGLIGHRDGQNNDSPIEIWCDNVLSYTFDLPWDAHTQEFSIDLRGVHQLRICRTDDRAFTDVIIGNPILR